MKKRHKILIAVLIGAIVLLGLIVVFDPFHRAGDGQPDISVQEKLK